MYGKAVGCTCDVWAGVLSSETQEVRDKGAFGLVRAVAAKG